MFHFYTDWKLQETKSFLTFPGGIEWSIELKWVRKGISDVYLGPYQASMIEYFCDNS